MPDKYSKQQKGKQPRRPHYIREWADKFGFADQASFAAAVGVDKSVVSRWYDGSSPAEASQLMLAEFFKCDRESLFRHPDDDWMAQFLKGRDKEEIQRIKDTLELAFPRKPPIKS